MARLLLGGLLVLASAAWVGLSFLPQILGDSRDLSACLDSWSSTDVLQKALVVAGVATAYLGYTLRDSLGRFVAATVVIGLVIAWASIAGC